MFNFSRNLLGYRLLMFIFVWGVIALLFTNWLVSGVLKNLIEGELERKANYEVNRLAYICRDPIIRADSLTNPTLAGYVKNLITSDPDISGVRIKNLLGTVNISNNQNDERTFVVKSAEITNYQGEEIGRVEIRYTDIYIKKKIIPIEWGIILFIFFSPFILGFLILWITDSYYVQPMFYLLKNLDSDGEKLIQNLSRIKNTALLPLVESISGLLKRTNKLLEEKDMIKEEAVSYSKQLESAYKELQEARKEETIYVNILKKANDELQQKAKEGEIYTNILKRANLELTQLINELEKNYKQISILNIMSSEVSKAPTVSELLSHIPEKVCTNFGYDRSIVYLVEEDKLKLVSGYCNNEYQDREKFMAYISNFNSIIDDDSVELEVVRKGEAIVSNDDKIDKNKISIYKLGGLDVRSYAVMPIKGNDRVIGVLWADRYTTNDSITQRDVEKLSIFANTIGLSIRNVKLYSDLQEKIRELGETNLELENMYKQVEESNKKLLELNKMKNDFIAITSHELRTPLVTAKGYVDIMLSEKLGPITEQQRNGLEVSKRNITRLINIVNDITDITKIDANKLTLKLEDVALKEIVKNIEVEMGYFIQQRKQTLNIDIPDSLPKVRVDRHRIHQVLTNLVMNAIRFTPDGGSITISGNIASTIGGNEAKFVEVRVKDTGIGIPKEEFEKIFERFYEIGSPKHHQSGTYQFMSAGTGLGLAIVKGFVEAHKGKVWVESEGQGKGSTFIFTIPAVEKIE